MRPPLIAGNWKMNGGPAACVALAQAIAADLIRQPVAAEIALAPPYTALAAVKGVIQAGGIRLAAQNCHWQDSGAFTGEISPPMLGEIGCDFVIVGHSERRSLFAESDQVIAQKISAVTRHKMRPILCVGETLEQRQKNETDAVLSHQIAAALKQVGEDAIEKIEIAYEPVWAIGSGLNASADQIEQAHQRIYRSLDSLFGAAKPQQVRILYGGSVKPENATMIAAIPDVSGLLVGGASLAADSFLAIVRAFS